MNKKSFIIVLALLLLAIAVSGAMIYFGPDFRAPQEQKETPLAPYLTRDMALFFLGRECLAEGDVYNYASCVLDIQRRGAENEWNVIITYDGLRDDSIRASQISAIINYQDGGWLVGEIIEIQKCQPGRGQQYFSAEFCI